MDRKADTKSNWSDLSAHPYCGIVRNWLRDGGVDPEAVEETHDGQILWRVVGPGGQSVILWLYEDQTGRPYFMLESAFARVRPEFMGKAATWLVTSIAHVVSPYRLAAHEDGKLVAQVRGRADSFTNESFSWLLRQLMGFAEETYRKLSANCPITPFCD